MLNFRSVNIVFISLLVSGVVTDFLSHIPSYSFLILFLAYSLILFYGCYYIGSNFFIRVICSAQTDKKVVAISFDDGPDAINTPNVLNILSENNVPAAFFCIGNRIAENADLLVQIVAQGHTIGNHSYSHHFWFDLFSSKKMLADMQLMDKEIVKVTGKTPKLFRPPYGVINPNLKKAIINGGYTTVGWGVRSMDTVAKDEQKLLSKIKDKLKPGAVFLFHDTCPITTAILPAFIEHVKSSGYEFIRLDKMLNLQPYA